ncbi:hypothetical protein [Marinobacterium aestuariivivens]|uniref:Integrase n=1 Tax=Marinobacterium aestuariivivens TaxID=1698799 RepID=A0ABW2A883_9GAMM
MNNLYDYYSAHLHSPVNVPNSRRETEIEYIFRVAREKAEAEKAERRREQLARFKRYAVSLLKSFGVKRTPSLHSLFGH